MRLTNFKFFLEYQDLSQSDVSRAAGVSRQRVSQWLASTTPVVNIGTQSLMNLALQQNISASYFLEEIAELEDESFLERTKAAVLWDNLFPNLGSFLRALTIGRSRAIARLVEVYGLFESASILGKRVWKDFPKYKKFLPPRRRKELEILWNRQRELKLI